ncbi:hypothetical protein [Kamptonema formosum]|uniref:hypothetical protein n=1 Tax=Kamptonema formosum TaxID=331992 RepID=UPI00034BAE18|nr:hypothetical protein [Oscillatoria sp. PCC 10802]
MTGATVVEVPDRTVSPPETAGCESGRDAGTWAIAPAGMFSTYRFQGGRRQERICESSAPHAPLQAGGSELLCNSLGASKSLKSKFRTQHIRGGPDLRTLRVPAKVSAGALQNTEEVCPNLARTPAAHSTQRRD